MGYHEEIKLIPSGKKALEQYETLATSYVAKNKHAINELEENNKNESGNLFQKLFLLGFLLYLGW